MSSRSDEAPLDKADNEHHAQFQHHMEVSNVENGKEPEIPEAIAKSETKQPGSTNSGKKRSSYQYDPAKVTLKFLFANHDGLTVTIECKPADTVGEIKGALLSTWPDGKIIIGPKALPLLSTIFSQTHSFSISFVIKNYLHAPVVIE
jgi:hypothetical protein